VSPGQPIVGDSVAHESGFVWTARPDFGAQKSPVAAPKRLSTLTPIAPHHSADAARTLPHSGVVRAVRRWSRSLALLQAPSKTGLFCMVRTQFSLPPSLCRSFPTVPQASFEALPWKEQDCGLVSMWFDLAEELFQLPVLPGAAGQPCRDGVALRIQALARVSAKYQVHLRLGHQQRDCRVAVQKRLNRQELPVVPGQRRRSALAAACAGNRCVMRQRRSSRSFSIRSAGDPICPASPAIHRPPSATVRPRDEPRGKSGNEHLGAVRPKE